MKKSSWRGLMAIVFFVAILFFLTPLIVSVLSSEPAVPTEETAEQTVTDSSALPGWWAKYKLNLGLDLRGGMQMLLEVNTSELAADEIDDAVNHNIRIIRERVDQFGVAEPSIQKLGRSRILVQLPGVKDDPNNAKNLIKQTAMLEFKLVADPQKTSDVMDAIDQYLKNNIQDFPCLTEAYQNLTVSAEPDTTQDSSPLDGLFTSLLIFNDGGYQLPKQNKPEYATITTLLADENFRKALPVGYQLALEKKDVADVNSPRFLHILQENAELVGSDVKSAKVEYGSPESTDPRIANKPYISLELNPEGRRKFERVTGNNVNRRLAIVLDGVVYSAPNIQERIAGGRAQITGRFTHSEAQELGIVLNTGNLKAPIDVLSEVTVGATLGSDSVKAGRIAGMIGLLSVVLFMALFYKLSGVIADIALLCNIGFILAMLTAFGATLTLPGIAGIILTIGMAVDANVLIFERIKEELDGGKTPRSAVDTGYKRAIITIWDANLTTLIAAAVLYNFGSGPIRGFAITLAIGIIGSMFTAIVLVRSFLENLLAGKTKTTLSI